MTSLRATRRRPALERVLRTADRLFYENGIRATGVDSIAETAQVSKASMYTYFRTKGDLVGAYLAERSRAWQARLVEKLASETDPTQKILLVFDVLGEWFITDDFNGCPFINAEAESTVDSPAHTINLRHRAWIREYFASLAAEAGADDPGTVSAQLAMLYDGAMIGAHTEPSLPWAALARSAAATLLPAA
jgi:AcrR family transcriptional regulator